MTGGGARGSSHLAIVRRPRSLSSSSGHPRLCRRDKSAATHPQQDTILFTHVEHHAIRVPVYVAVDHHHAQWKRHAN